MGIFENLSPEELRQISENVEKMRMREINQIGNQAELLEQQQLEQPLLLKMADKFSEGQRMGIQLTLGKLPKSEIKKVETYLGRKFSRDELKKVIDDEVKNVLIEAGVNTESIPSTSFVDAVKPNPIEESLAIAEFKQEIDKSGNQPIVIDPIKTPEKPEIVGQIIKETMGGVDKVTQEQPEIKQIVQEKTDIQKLDTDEVKLPDSVIKQLDKMSDEQFYNLVQNSPTISPQIRSQLYKRVGEWGWDTPYKNSTIDEMMTFFNSAIQGDDEVPKKVSEEKVDIPAFKQLFKEYGDMPSMNKFFGDTLTSSILKTRYLNRPISGDESTIIIQKAKELGLKGKLSSDKAILYLFGQFMDYSQGKKGKGVRVVRKRRTKKVKIAEPIYRTQTRKSDLFKVAKALGWNKGYRTTTLNELAQYVNSEVRKKEEIVDGEIEAKNGPIDYELVMDQLEEALQNNDEAGALRMLPYIKKGKLCTPTEYKKLVQKVKNHF